MDPQAILVVVLTLGMLVALVSGKARVDAIGLLLMVGLVAGGILSYKEAVAGFGNKAILTIAGLYIIGEGLTRTGALEIAAKLLGRVTRGSASKTIFITGLFAAAMSSLLNDTAVVLVMLPIVLGLARESGISPSYLLMPLSFGSLMGGMNTLIGTSTNILVSGVAEEMGQAPIGMFEMTPIALVLCLAGLAYLAVFAPRLLPKRQSLSSMMSAGEVREYMTELVIGPSSTLLGTGYAEFARDLRVQLIFFVRGEDMHWPSFDSEKIQVGDVLMLRGNIDAIADLQTRLDLRFAAGQSSQKREMQFFELALAPHSPLVGRRVAELQLWRDYRAVTVALLRDGHHIRERISQVHLRAGDLLLVMADDDAETRLRAGSDFYLLTGSQQHVRLRIRGKRAVAVAGIVVLLFALGAIWEMKALPQPFVAILGALGMIATGCVTPRRVYRTIDWPILIFIAGTIALGDAMAKTGVAADIASLIVGFLDQWGELAILSGFVLLCILMNSLIAHSAVAVLLTPIAIQTAQAFSLAQGYLPESAETQNLLRASILAIAFGGSLCFASPIGHQVNLMVLGPGSYRYRDFLKLGLPLSLLAWGIIVFGLHFRYGN